ncbi:MAG: VanZ family protein [Acidobacteriota bacterium]
MDANQTAGEGLTLMKRVGYWLPVVAMILVMFGFSTDAFSGENTQGIIVRLIRWLGLDPNSRAALRINFALRKLAHLTEYAVLAALVYRAFRSGRHPRWRARWAAESMAIVVVWALMDEYHQSLTETRTGSIYDSLIDMAGGLIALAVIYRVSLSQQKKDDFA